MNMALLWLGTSLQAFGVVLAGGGVLLGGKSLRGIWRRAGQREVTVFSGRAQAVGNISVEVARALAAFEERTTSMGAELDAKLDHLRSEVDLQKERMSTMDKEINDLATRGLWWTFASIVFLLAGVFLTAVATV
jgi:hypothetical protein